MAVASDVAVYLRQTANLDGSMSVPSVPGGVLAYTWTLGLAAPGSSLQAGTVIGMAATASFVPDVIGQYTVVLKVSTPPTGLPQDSKAVKVTAVLPQVFYAQGTVTDAGSAAGYSVVDFDGGNAHPVVCPSTGPGNQISIAAAYGSRLFDFWEAPPGQPAEFAALGVDYDKASNGYTAHLYSGTAISACDGGVTDLGQLGAAGRPYGANPHLSPDGTRIAVFKQDWSIVTYPFDGGGPVNTVASDPYPASSPLDTTNASNFVEYVQEPPRVEWMPPGSSTDLAWAKLSDTGVGWQVVTAKDVSAAQTTTLINCSSGVVPREIVILPDQSVVASYRATPTSAENIVRITAPCVIAQRYTNLDGGSAIATDFAVSPKGDQLAFLLLDPSSQDAGPWMLGAADAGKQLPGGYVYVVGVDGGTPTPVSPTPALYGPRYLGAGKNVVFTALKSATTPPSISPMLGTRVMIAEVNGTTEHAVAEGDGVNTFVSSSGSAACSISPGRSGASAAGALLSGAALVQLVRRRRTKRR
jgi:hypothetical protein